MYRYLTYLFFTVGCWMGLSAGAQEPMVFNQDGTPCDALVKILELTGVQHDGTVKDIITQTQQRWLRKPGVERWDLETTSHKEHQLLVHQFTRLGLLQELKPTKQEYDYVLFMGATAARMKKRFEYLVDLSRQGIRFKNLVILSGARPLDEKLKERDYLATIMGDACPNAATEKDAAVCIVDMSRFLDKTIRCIVVDAPMKQDQHGNLQRPTTDDTLVQFKKMGFKPGSALVISNQPYGLRQQTVTENFLSDTCDCIDVAAEECSQHENDAVILDELARLMYMEYKRFFEKKD